MALTVRAGPLPKRNKNLSPLVRTQSFLVAELLPRHPATLFYVLIKCAHLHDCLEELVTARHVVAEPSFLNRVLQPGLVAPTA